MSISVTPFRFSGSKPKGFDGTPGYTLERPGRVELGAMTSAEKARKRAKAERKEARERKQRDAEMKALIEAQERVMALAKREAEIRRRVKEWVREPYELVPPAPPEVQSGKLRVPGYSVTRLKRPKPSKSLSYNRH